jgi:cysteinyl-tRNA synthetase
MEIKIQNTLSHKKETFEPLVADKVSMYHCGPTVYNTPHIGNYRTFILNDLIRRVFEYNGYQVDQAMNITDVDDKTIRGSREAGESLTSFTQKYEKLFLEEIDSLNIKRPHKLIRATENINEMIKMISTLLEKGYAYSTKDGVYLSIEKVKDYGKLADLDLTKISKERIHNDNYDKENPRDFSLWKFKSEDDGDVAWSAPFGEGRPGWHIECSAMSTEALGKTIDIHTGGIDLIFPHHTNEIAQSECATGETFVQYWIHGGFVNIANEKMAKSANNFFKISDLIENSVSPLGYRYWLLTAHYRSPVNFTYEAVLGAQNALIKLIKLVMNLPKGGSIDAGYKEKFNQYINDDFDLPRAVALTWELVSDGSVSEADKRATIVDFDRVFGLKLDAVPEIAVDNTPIPDEIIALKDAREEARQAKDWAKADALRKEIEDRGYEVLDSKEGAKVAQR